MFHRSAEFDNRLNRIKQVKSTITQTYESMCEFKHTQIIASEYKKIKLYSTVTQIHELIYRVDMQVKKHSCNKRL